MTERRFLFRWAAGALVLAGCAVLAACSEQGAKFQGVDVSQSNYAQELPLADHNGQQRREGQRHARRMGKKRHHATNHHELALREIHNVRRIVDDGEPKSDQRIDRANRQP